MKYRAEVYLNTTMHCQTKSYVVVEADLRDDAWEKAEEVVRKHGGGWVKEVEPIPPKVRRRHP